MNSQRDNRSRNKDLYMGEKIQMALVWVIFANAILLLSFVLVSSGMLSLGISEGNEANLSELLPDEVTPGDIISGGDSDIVDDGNVTTQTKVGSTISERNTNVGTSSNSSDDGGSTDGTGTGKGN